MNPYRSAIVLCSFRNSPPLAPIAWQVDPFCTLIC